MPGCILNSAVLTRVFIKLIPALVCEVAPGAVLGEAFDALLRQDTHINLKAHQREHRQREHGQYYHITQILYRLYYSTNDGFQAWKRDL